jgi:mRNA interferase RelE/StbE
MYQLIYSEHVLKQLKKLNDFTKNRIVTTLERIRIRPYKRVKKLVGSKYFRLRVGDYRIIVNIKEDKLIILVLELGHRKNIYN